MNIYEAIFKRHSVRHYRMEEIADEVLRKIPAFYQGIKPLFPGIETEIGITANPEGKRILKGFFGVNAPYYLSIYSEVRDRYKMNAGYICEQISLYMTTIGLGSCFLGSTSIRQEPLRRGSHEFVIVMAFGIPKEPLTRRGGEARRLPVRELCVARSEPTKWMKQVLEAARLAPSSMNRQPWRFVIVGNRMHIFSKKNNMDHPKFMDEFNFGIMFANIMVTSEEFWLDVDLIRLDNISQKSFQNNQYVLTAVVKNPS